MIRNQHVGNLENIAAFIKELDEMPQVVSWTIEADKDGYCVKVNNGTTTSSCGDHQSLEKPLKDMVNVLQREAR